MRHEGVQLFNTVEVLTVKVRSEVGGGFFHGWEDVDKFIDAGHFQDFFHDTFGSGDAHFASFFFDLGLTENEDTDASAVEHRDSMKVDNNLFDMLVKNLSKLEFHIAGIVAHDDAASHFQDGDVWGDLFPFDR